MNNPETTASSIIILDTHPLFRKGLARLLKENFPQTLLSEAKNLQEIGQSLPEIEMAVFIIVINSDFEEDGTNPVAEIKRRYPLASIILYAEELKPELIISYFKSGIKGYLFKHENLTELIDCIQVVNQGNRYINAEYKEVLLSYLIENYKSSRKQDLLTPRQNEVARYLIQGLTTSAIAEATGLHISTISTFKTAIFTKLGVDNVLRLKQVFETDQN
ncbi:response regulator transcription factor [Dyadobacter sp. UP-52]|uniref:Response regulator transcription factor n=2 Tax=Dyadobacter subterraneus TaxID=2773304 RepID=A0ABR9WG36_9BACT|nr:response regulator transcription factor [Dyadobacter subterraneus]